MSGLIELHIPGLRRFAWALAKNASEADDLVQDCLERAIAHWNQRRGDHELRPWLMQIMHNIHVSRWRLWKRRGGDPLPIEDWDAPSADDPEQRVGLIDAMSGLARLPDDQRTVLLLIGVEGLSYAEVASVVGVPVGTVMSRLSRGREKLRHFIEGEPSQSLLRRVK